MFTLPELTYPYDALEPHIDARTMQIHHDLHHGGYVNKLNAALEDREALKTYTIEDLITKLDTLPELIRTAVRNNGGGHYNHTLFWETMGPNGGDGPSGALDDAIRGTFGSFETFQDTVPILLVAQMLISVDSLIVQVPNAFTVYLDSMGYPLENIPIVISGLELHQTRLTNSSGIASFDIIPPYVDDLLVKAVHPIAGTITNEFLVSKFLTLDKIRNSKFVLDYKLENRIE